MLRANPSLPYIYPPVKINLFGNGIISVVQRFRLINISLVFLDDYLSAHQILVQFCADMPARVVIALVQM